MLLQPLCCDYRYTLVAMDNKAGEWLRERRRKLGLMQSDVAKRAGVSTSYISTLERGQKHSLTNATLRPDRDKVIALAKAVKGNPDELLLLYQFAPEQPFERDKPQSVAELLQRLAELGVDQPIFKDGIESLPDDPDALDEILRVIAMTVEIELRKKNVSHNASSTERGLLHE